MSAILLLRDSAFPGDGQELLCHFVSCILTLGAAVDNLQVIVTEFEGNLSLFYIVTLWRDGDGSWCKTHRERKASSFAFRLSASVPTLAQPDVEFHVFGELSFLQCCDCDDFQSN